MYIFKVRFKKGFIDNNGRRIALKAGYDIIYIKISTYLMFTTKSTRQRINNVVGGGAGGGGSIAAYIDY